jgi:beta-xylosidase
MLGDKDGKVPEIMQKPVQGQERKALTVSDDFSGEKLGLWWQWNHNPVDEAWSLTERPGYLRLKTNKAVPSIYHARNTLTQRMEGPTCQATVALDLKKMKNGDVAGFSAFNSDAAVLAVTKRDGKLYLTMSEESVSLANDTKAITGVKRNVKEEFPLKKKTIYLRIEGDFRPGATKDQIKCYYSLNNKKWHKIGPDYITRFDWQRFFMGTKFAIFNYATQKPGGYVDVDWFEYSK